VQVETSPGGPNPATPGEHYTELEPGTEVVIPPGETSATVDVDALGPLFGQDRTLLLKLTGARAFNPVPRFQSTALSYPIAGSLPRSMAVTDLNGDGRRDIVTGNDLSLTLSVLLSRDEGGFAEAVTYSVPDPVPLAFAAVVAVGDVTGDGLPDLVAAGFNTDFIRVFAGDGTGSFTEAPAIPLGSPDIPSAIALADVNQDRRPDIVVTIGAYARVMVLLAREGGGFGRGASFPTGRGPRALAIADLDGDGDLDLLTANEVTADVSMLAGNGAGSFARPRSIATGPDTSPVSVAAGDVNGDEQLDIVSGNLVAAPPGAPATVSVMLGDGRGGFAEAQQHIVGEGAGDLGIDPPGQVAIDDVTGDGRADVAVTLPVANLVALLAGTPEGELAPAVRFPVAAGPQAIAIADVTGDDNPDVLSSNGVAASVSVLPGDGAGNLGFDKNFAAGAVPHSVAAADFDGDGDPDAAVANTFSDSLSVLTNDGTGTFAGREDYPVGAAPTWVVADDVDGNGTVDLVAANFGGASVSVLLGDGAGRFATPVQYSVGELQSPYAVAAADVNADGWLDIATANTNLSDEGASVLLADGAGGFAEPIPLEVGPAVLHDPRAIALADVTGDGHVDLLTANSVSSNLSLLAGDGTGAFASPVHLVAGEGPVVVEVADVTGDGLVDIVSLDHTAQTVSTLAGDGAGGFAKAAHHSIYSPSGTPCTIDPNAVCPWAWGMNVDDVNNDGHLDIVTANTAVNTVSVLTNDGKGGFPSFESFHTGAAPRSVAVADANGDGNPDLVTANQDNNNFSVLVSGLNRVDIAGSKAIGTLLAGDKPDDDPRPPGDDPDPDDDPDPNDDDGCGCSARGFEGGGAASLAPLLLALLLLRRRPSKKWRSR
jgi:FG-GAP-like repeat/FG-GAP repeat